MSIKFVIPSNHLILCRPLLLLPSIFPSFWSFSSESALHPNLRSPQPEEEEKEEANVGTPIGQLALASAALDRDDGRKRRPLPPPGLNPETHSPC